jgi:beta-glucanase (GH16 family)
VEKLTRKLKWYVENQDLLDKSTKAIKARDEEINQLKKRIEELQTEVRFCAK